MVHRIRDSIRLGWLLLVGVLLLGCGSIRPASISNANGTVRSIWSNPGASLPAGHRTLVDADSSGWILTESFVGDTLTLSRISLIDGSLLGSFTIDTAVQGYAGAGISSDGSGRLWITYGHRLTRFDEASKTSVAWK